MAAVTNKLAKGLLRGAAAGAAGTTALNASTQADMALRGRPASETPTDVVSKLAGNAGLDIPGKGQERRNRLEGMGALGGAFTGIGVGALAGGMRAAGLRLPTAVGGPLIGVAAMAAGNLPIVRLGISDPREWSRADWLSDVIPHLVFGMATHATLTAMFRQDERPSADEPVPVSPEREPRRPALWRAAALGAATGCRSSAGLTALALRSPRTSGGLPGLVSRPALRLAGGAAVAVELGVDKHPSVPSRLSRQGLPPRIVFASAAAGAAAHRDGFKRGTAAVVAALAAATTAIAGNRLRALAARRFGSDVPGAIVEDVAAVALAWAGAGRKTD